MNRNRERARIALDRRLAPVRTAHAHSRPQKGWIQAIRESLGMNRVQLAKRMGITPQSLAELERSEESSKIGVQSLERAAEALDCRLVYALVPNDSLQERVERRAQDIAAREIGAISHSMDLEDQTVEEGDDARRIRDFIAMRIRESDLWNDPDGPAPDR